MIQALQILKRSMEIKLHNASKELTKEQYLKGKEKIGYISMAISHIDEMYDRISWWEKKVGKLELKYLVKSQENLKVKRENHKLKTELQQMKDLFLTENEE